MQRFASFLAAGVLAATASAQFSVVTPNGYGAVEGDSVNAFPWNTANNSHIQWIYDSSNFTLQGVTYPILISALQFRADAAATTVTWGTGSWPNVVVDVGPAAVDYLSMTTTYANNRSGTMTNVLTGPVTVTPGTGNGAGVPGPWYITIPFATPVLYDPNSGVDLLVDVIKDQTGFTGVTRSPDHVTQSAGAGGPSLTKRVYRSDATALTAATGLGVDFYGAVMDFSYTPAAGLYAGFTANVTGGPSPLAVNFTDQTFTSDPGGITSWAWDLDGDNVIDSTVQNPSFVYNACGNYNVSLTVTDATHPPSTQTRTAYIQTDRIAANFTDQLIAPLVVQFTDTSNMPATSWAWDLDGDSIIDSTLQTPAWVYANTNPVAVTLTVTRLCAPPSTITRTIVPAQVLTTNLAANNGVGTPATLYFDLNVLNPGGVSIGSFDTITSTISTAFTADVYLKVGSYVGSEHNAAPWTLVGTASGTTAPVANQPANSAFATPLYVPAGSYGVAIRYVGAYPRYVTLPALTTWSNGDLSLTAGAASLSTAGPFTGTNLNSPRGWAGSIYYSTHSFTGNAGYGFFAPGCAGSMGVSHLSSNTPQLGGTLNVTLNNLPLSVAILMIGFSNTASPFGPLPLDATPFGAPGCFGRVSPDVTSFLIGGGNTAVWSLTIPNDPSLSGMKLFNQGLVPDPGFNALGAVFSDAAGMIFGS